jgi:hypothetical protein
MGIKMKKQKKYSMGIKMKNKIKYFSQGAFQWV